jgi:hypothetical protein
MIMIKEIDGVKYRLEPNNDKQPDDHACTGCAAFVDGVQTDLCIDLGIECAKDRPLCVWKEINHGYN